MLFWELTPILYTVMTSHPASQNGWSVRGHARVPLHGPMILRPPTPQDSTRRRKTPSEDEEEKTWDPQSTIRRSGRAKRLIPLAAALLLAAVVAIPSSGIA